MAETQVDAQSEGREVAQTGFLGPRSSGPACVLRFVVVRIPSRSSPAIREVAVSRTRCWC